MPYRRKKRVFFLLFFIAFFVLIAFTAQAQGPKLSLDIKAEKEVQVLEEGRWVTQIVPLEESRPGDILYYTLKYTNEGDTVAKDASIVDPIPAGTVYVLESASGEGAQITYSIDGGHSYQLPPVTYVINKADGSHEEKMAPAQMYTHIKWLIKKPVLPGQSGQLSFKAKIK